MAECDRSRSPEPERNRLEPPGQPQALPCFPRWLSCLDLTQHATTSESNKMASVPVGTLYDGTHVDTNSTVLSTQLDYVSTFSTNSTTYASSKHRRTPGFVRKKRYPKILVDFKIIVSQHKHCNLVCRSVLFADKQDKPRYRICIYIAKLKQ